ncbi:MAG: hypothetical protein EAX90_11555 [Candidatus Heimdallarchaeota archaeon]|nr:hypothetical protein [Candidatus Heimdallarchaeota archaeon]
MADLNLLWAILAQLASTSFNFIGMTIQKKAANSLPLIGEEAGFLKSIKNFALNKEWVFGFFLNFVSVVLSAISFALAAISMVQPFYGFGLIVLVIFTHFYLKEKITWLDLIGVIIGIIGIVAIGISAVPSEQLYYTVVLEKFLDLRGILFLSIFLGIALIFYIISEKTPKSVSIVFLVISSSIWTATSFIFYKAISAAVRDIGLIAAFFGEGWSYTWSFILLIGFVSAIGLVMLNIAYQNGFCVIIVPIFSSIQVILPVLAGIIIFSEWMNYGTLTIIGQTIGIIIILISVIILSISNGKKEDACKFQVKIDTESNDYADELNILEN